MSKELEALKKIRECYGKDIVEAIWLPNAIDYTKTITVNDYCDIIETALKEEYLLAEHYITYSKKQNEVLKIIKEKNVNVRAFKKVLLMEQNDDVKLRAYNSQNHRYEDDITKAEFDLVKEVLKNEKTF